MSSNNNKPLTKLSCEELVALLKQENITQKVTNFFTENDVTGLDFSDSNFIDENILCEETKAVVKLLPAQVSALRKVHARLCASESEPTTTTNAAASSSAEAPHQTPPASPVTQQQQLPSADEIASPLINTHQNASSSNELNATTSQQHSPAASSLSPIEVDPGKPITELCCAELVEVLRQKKVKESILNYLKEYEVQGPDFAHPDFIENEILTDDVKSKLKLLDSQIATLRDVHRSLCSNSAAPSSPIAENTSPTSSPRSGFQHQDPNSPVSPLSAPNPSTLELLKVEVDKFPQLDDATADKLQTAVSVLEGLKKHKGYAGTLFGIVHGVVSAIHNANGGAKKDCLKLIAKVSRIVAGPNARFIFNPPREFVPMFREVIALAKEAKLLIAKFIPLTKEDRTFFSNVARAAALFGAYEKDFELIDKKINNIHIEISSTMSTATYNLQRDGLPVKIDPRARARHISDMKTFINEIKESCRTWYNNTLELDVASSSPTKQTVKLENLFVDLKIQRQVNASSIAENAAGEYADTSNLQKHLFSADSSQQQKNNKLLTLIEGPAGCGKTTCCQEFTRLQQIEGAFVIFIALKELLKGEEDEFGCGRIESIQDILNSVLAPKIILESLPEILKYNIPIVWILDGFDEVMLTDDGSVRYFLKNFVDPTTRKKNIENKVLPDLVRPCDAVIISSRENRVDNKDVVVLNNLDSSLAPDRWVIQRWRRDAISRYVLKHFEKAGKPLSDAELNAIVDKTLSPQMQGFHGIPLFIKLICDLKLEDATFDVSKISPPFLYQKNLRQAFDRATVRISYLLNQDASWMKYENDRDKLFNDIVLPSASKRALDEFVTHEGTALTFKVPQNEAIPLWLSVMLEMGLLQRDKQSDNSFKFPHRTFIEFLAAKHVSLHAAEAMPKIPFKDELNTTWLLMSQLANQRETDGFFSKLTTTGLTSPQLAKFVAKTFVAQYLKMSDADRHSTNDDVISACVREISLKLFLQLAVALPGDMLMDEMKSVHGAVVLNAPSHLKWMIEWCGVYGAIKVLKWIDKKFPSVVKPEKVSNAEEQSHVVARCRRGLARALQTRGANASSHVEECIDFYLPRAGDLEAEDAVAADSYSVLQEVLTRRPWQGSAAQLSKLVLACISKRKSHPNLLASLLVFLQLDEDSNKKKCMPFLQLALFFAPEKLEIQNEDKSVEVFNFAEKVKETQRWVRNPLYAEIFAEEELMKELLKNDNDMADAFKECSKIEVDDENDLSVDDFVIRKLLSDTLPTISAEEFLHRGFTGLKYGGDESQYVLDTLNDELPLTLKYINLSLCAKEISDASLAALPPKYSSSLQTLNLLNCDRITDSGLQHLAQLSSLQSLDLGECILITDSGLEHLSKLPSLQALNIYWCNKITDSGLQDLAKLSSLQSLDLQYCNKITDSGLEHLSELSSLQTLDISGCDMITDSGLDYLSELSSLQTLNLTRCDMITDSGLDYLSELSSLQTLNLEHCDKITDSGLQLLANLSFLQSLNLHYCKEITDSGLQHLANLLSLRALNLSGCAQITDSGLQHLVKLSSLQSLNLESCNKITDSGLQHLGKLSSLQSLNLHFCDKVTDSGLRHLANLSSLQSLNLHYCREITDSGLQHLGKLSSLKSLNLTRCDEISDSGLQQLAELSSLQSLNLESCWKITGSGFQHLGKLSSLKSLNLTRCDEISDSGLQQLAELSSLQSLNLVSCCKITGSGFQHLTKLSSLQSINLHLCKQISDGGLQQLAELSSLQSLNLEYCKQITDGGLQHLAKLSSLQSLNLNCCDKITHSGLQHLTKLSSLHTLNLYHCDNITDSGLQHLAKLSSLQSLSFHSCDKVTDSGLRHLANLSSLESLNLSYCGKITNSGLQHLAKLPSLKSLILERCVKINDSGLQHLAKLSTLRTLNLDGCDEITDSGLQHLAKQSTLQTLDLGYCNITDSGLQHLIKLSSLKSLNLLGCKNITDSGLEHLAKLSSLRSLNVTHCDNITDEGYHSFPISAKVIRW